MLYHDLLSKQPSHLHLVEFGSERKHLRLLRRASIPFNAPDRLPGKIYRFAGCRLTHISLPSSSAQFITKNVFRKPLLNQDIGGIP
jgi:hypothetical protein